MKSFSQIDSESLLRGRVYDNLDLTRVTLANLLGYPNFHSMYRDFSAEDKRKCEMLAGPNGKTIYKIMLLKRSSKTGTD